MDMVMPVRMPTRAQKSCLNCRERKIACDRSLPTCSSCLRRKKVCSGYELNLSWPREGDERRSATADVRSRSNHKTGPLSFLNTSSWDTSLQREHAETGSHKNHIGVWISLVAPPRPISIPRFGTKTAPLNNPQISSAVRLITSRGDLRQDVCGLLYRMSLADNSVPSLAVRHSMNAISYLYLQRREDAIYHQMLAVSALQGTINQNLDYRTRAQAIAASLLLSLYEVLSQSGKNSNWSVHFDGCMTIVKSGHQRNRKYAGEYSVLLNWVFYHNVLYKLSIQHWVQRTPQMEAIANRDMFITSTAFGIDLVTIHSTLGCSLELLDFLSQAVDLVKERRDPQYLSKAHLIAINALEQRVKDIDQRLCAGIDKEEFHAVGSRHRYVKVARLFQIAVIIYIDRVVRGSSMSSSLSRTVAKEAFGLLADLGVCERPFPLFIMSLQAETDAERLLMLSALHNMTEERPLSNLAATEQMIRRIWAQQDLQGVEQADALFILNAIVSANSIPPSFT